MKTIDKLWWLWLILIAISLPPLLWLNHWCEQTNPVSWQAVAVAFLYGSIAMVVFLFGAFFNALVVVRFVIRWLIR